MAPPITQTFDPSIGEYGQDYAVPVGTPIYSPVNGTVSTEDMGKQDWGKRVHVFLSSADAAVSGITSFAVGHLTSFAVTSGQHVKAGDLLGYSGGAVSDPSSGNSTGPHVEPQFFKGSTPINPVDIFERFTSWEQAIFRGGARAAGTTAGQAAASDPISAVANAIGDATSTVTSTVSNLTSILTRAFWFAFALGLGVLGLFLIFAGDLEKMGEKAADVAEKVAPEAAVAAA